MSLLVLMLLFGPLCLSPLWTHHLYSQLLEVERTQISLDNSAIVLGQEERKFWRQVWHYQRGISQAEKVHHAVHACAHVPGPQAPVCQAKDKACELALRATQRLSYVYFVALWKQALVKAVRSGGVEPRFAICVQGRPFLPPLQSRTCRFCQLKVGWKPSPAATQSSKIVPCTASEFSHTPSHALVGFASVQPVRVRCHHLEAKNGEEIDYVIERPSLQGDGP